MDTLERIEHFKKLLPETRAQIAEGYLRHLQRVTRLLDNLTKPTGKIRGLRKIISEEMDDLRAYAELFDISIKLNDSLKEF